MISKPIPEEVLLTPISCGIGKMTYRIYLAKSLDLLAET